MYRNVNYAQIRTESLYVFVDNDFISTSIDQTIIESKKPNTLTSYIGICTKNIWYHNFSITEYCPINTNFLSDESFQLNVLTLQNRTRF
jgi:hypothetical protein